MACRARALAAAGSPAKHLFGLNRAGQSAGPMPLAPQPVFQPRDRTPRGGPETHSSTPLNYPFKLMSAARSFIAELQAPVFCGRALGADTPKSFRSEVMWFAR